MKLLFDENLSRQLVRVVHNVFPDSAHVSSLGLLEATDMQIWDFALQNGYTIVSKDRDFANLSAVFSNPPKVVWLRVGNASTRRVASLLADHLDDLTSFQTAEGPALLIISLPPDQPLPLDARDQK